MRSCHTVVKQSIVAGVVAMGIIVSLAFDRAPENRASAMPNFAQALGVDCKFCHTQVPQLNSYGRYVQRSMYSALDPKQVNRAVPFWVGQYVYYDSQDPNLPHQIQAGNTELNFDGDIGAQGNETFRYQQWIWQANQPGGVDNLWASYNEILNRDGHVVVGKQFPVGPSAFSQWADISGFAIPSITVGEHPYLLSSNQWGAKFSYAPAKGVAEVGYFYNTSDLGGATTFNPYNADGSTNEKSIQYHVAYAPANRPYAVGVYGDSGTFPLVEGGIDRFGASGAYAQADPTKHLPGAFLLYQFGNDGNSGGGIPAHSNGYAAEVYYQPFRHWETLVGVRREMTNDGLGNISNGTLVDVNLRILKYLHATGEAGMASGSIPAWRFQVFYTTPVFGLVRQ